MLRPIGSLLSGQLILAVAAVAVGGVLAIGFGGCTPTPPSRQAQWEAPHPLPTPTTPSQSPTPPPLPASLAAKLPTFSSPPPPDPGTEPPSNSAAWFSAIPTKQPVAFLTIDDGFTKDPELI